MEDNKIEELNKEEEKKEEMEIDEKKEEKEEEKIPSSSHKKNNEESEINIDVPINETEKKVLITETLQNQYDNLDVPSKIKRGVSESLNKTNENIKNDINQNNIQIKSVSSNVNSILNNSNILKRRLSRETIKKLKNLKNNEQQIKITIQKLDDSKKFIEGQSQIGLKGGIVEENIKRAKLREIDERKEELNLRLYDLNLQMEKITDLTKPTKNEIMHNFYDNFEKDRDLYKEKAKRYLRNSLESTRKLTEDKKITFERREKMLIEKEKEDLEKKEKIFAEKNEKERQNMIKRKKEIEQKLEKTKQHINEKNQKTEKEYLYYINKEKFDNEELKLIEKTNIKKKESITKEELQELDSKLKKQKKNMEMEEKEKTKLLHEMWNDRNQLVQSYKTNAIINLEKEEKQKKEEEKKKLEKIKELEASKKNYSNKAVPKPIINQKLKKSREERTEKIDKRSVLNTEINNKRRIEMYHFQSPKIKSLSNISIDNISNIKSAEFNGINNKNHKLKPIRLLHPKPEKPINYLDDFKKKNKANKKLVSITLDEKDKGRNLYQKIKIVQDQATNVDNKVRMKKEEMKIKGGYVKNTKIGDEIGDMLIQSIEAKINIMNKLNE